MEDTDGCRSTSLGSPVLSLSLSLTHTERREEEEWSFVFCCNISLQSFKSLVGLASAVKIKLSVKVKAIRLFADAGAKCSLSIQYKS